MDSKHVELVATPSYDTLPVYRVITTEEAQPPTYCAPTTSTSATTLDVPTAGPNFSSGFPYHSSLTDFNVSPAEWEAFTQELQNAAAATPGQKALAVLSGIATAAVIIDPWTSSCVARYVWNKQVTKNAITRLDQNDNNGSSCGHKGETVGAVMKRWNEKWSVMGVAVGLEVVQVGKETCGTLESKESMEHGSTCCKREEGRCGTRKRCGAKGSCEVWKNRASHKSCGAKERSCRRTTCGRRGVKGQPCCGKRAASFKLVVRRTENAVSEKKE